MELGFAANEVLMLGMDYTYEDPRRVRPVGD